MEFDPAKISFAELLDIFWGNAEPENPSFSRQYMTIIFYHNEEQKKFAEKSKEIKTQAARHKIYVEILPDTTFHLAESYHQKYYLRGIRELMKEFDAMFQSDMDFINSTAAARVNGYISGCGKLAQLNSELDRLGLSAAGNKRLLAMVQARDREPVRP